MDAIWNNLYNVQLFLQGDLFPADGAVGNVASDNVERAMFNVPSAMIVSEAKEANNLAMDKNKINENRYRSMFIAINNNALPPFQVIPCIREFLSLHALLVGKFAL